MISSKKITTAFSNLFFKKNYTSDKTPIIEERPTVVIENRAIPASKLKNFGISKKTAKRFLFLIALLPSLTFAQRERVQIKSDIFEIVYSEVYQQPLYVKYKVKCTGEESVKFSRKGLDFYKCDSVITSDAKDYVKNVYDKGHMAPAAAFSCNEKDLKATFTYLNCSFQNQYLNRGAWRLLEEHERDLMIKYNGDITVEIEVEFTEKSIDLPTGGKVPTGYFKTIWTNSPKPMVLEKYYFPNDRPTSSDYRIYKISK